MRKLKILIIIILLFSLCGCYNYRELNEIAIVSAIGIDKTDDGYKMAVQIMNTKKEGQDTNSSGSQPKFIVYTAEGKTIQGILRDFVLESPRRLYATHLQLLVISEDLAKNGISDILDWFARDSESRKQFYVLVSENSQSEDILNTLTSLETLNSKKITSNIDTDTRFLGVAEQTTFENVLATYLNDKQELVLPSIRLEGDSDAGEKNSNIEQSSPKTQIFLSPLAVFKDDKMLGYLTKEESMAMSFIKNKLKSTVIDYKWSDNDYISSEIISSKTSLQPDTSSDKPKVTIKIKGKANINEINCDWDLENNETILKINKMLEQEIENIINDSIDSISQRFDSDIFGFKDLFYKKDPKYYKTIKDQLTDENLKKLDVKVEVDMSLPQKGNILRVIKR